jgi:hypothetical protein
LIHRVEELFREQLQAWPLLREGVSGLATSETRPVRIDWFEVLVRHIPHRVSSTTAPVDPEAVRRRPCFLCPENLAPEEKGILFGPDYAIYCNPFPIVERHLTIVHREHRPQRLEGQIGVMLDIAAALPGFFVIYNGPECGASAPDHMHLQAGSRKVFPIAKDTARLDGPAITGYARTALLFRGKESSHLVDETSHALELLSFVTGRRPEPWCNVATFHEPGAGWTVYLFPRAKHRPDVFHTGEMIVSPAAIDLCGLLVVPLARDFERISGDQIASVFREVTLPNDQFLEVVAGLERAR